nr:MAG TPA: hypothetical protein [Caudoviricetes sp.]
MSRPLVYLQWRALHTCNIYHYIDHHNYYFCHLVVISWSLITLQR